MKGSADRTYGYDLLLLAVTFFWGATFILVKRAVEIVDIFTFLSVRFTVAFLILSPALGRRWARLGPRELTGGLALGTALFLSFAFQTAGLRLTTASNAAFITGLAVILVPVLMALLYRVHPPRLTSAGAATAAAGLYLLTGAGEGGTLGGDLLVLACAFFVAVHLLLTARFVEDADPFLLAALQLGVVGAWSLLATAVHPGRVISFAPIVLWAWLITIFMATIFAFVVQTAAQRVVPPAKTAIIFTMEPVFGAIFARIFGGEFLSAAGVLGGILILSGMVLTEVAPARWTGLGGKPGRRQGASP